MNHLRRQFPVWGTIVDVDCSSEIVSGADLDRAMEKVIEFCQDVDRDFSTYKDDSLHNPICRENSYKPA